MEEKRREKTSVSIAISRISFKIFDSEAYCDLEIQVRGHSPSKFMHDLYIESTGISLFTSTQQPPETRSLSVEIGKLHGEIPIIV